MKLSRTITTAVAVLFAAAGSLAAQGTATTTAEEQVPVVAAPATEAAPVAAPAATPDASASLAPFAGNATVGVHEKASSTPGPIAPPRRDHVGNNVALMIVGGAVLIVGAIVGGTAGTIIMVGGAAVGIVGLYRYLQ